MRYHVCATKITWTLRVGSQGQHKLRKLKPNTSVDAYPFYLAHTYYGGLFNGDARNGGEMRKGHEDRGCGRRARLYSVKPSFAWLNW